MHRCYLLLIISFLMFSISFALTEIDSCQNLTIPGETYQFNQSITDNQSNGRCIDIQVDNVTLDCANYNTTGSGISNTYGIYANGYNNITIKNCGIYNYDWGLPINGNSNNITNNTINSNHVGIAIQESVNTTVENNVLYNNTMDGIHFDASAINNNITNNTLSSGMYGIRLKWGANNNTIKENTIYSNSVAGINMDMYCSYNNITNNTFYNNTYGIYLMSSSDNIFAKNIIYNSSIWDFYSADSSGSLIINLTTNDTTSSFTYGGEISLKSASSPGADPSGNYSIGKFLNVTGNSWIFLNISYTFSDLGGINESTLFIARHNGTWETDTSAFASTYGVDTVNSYVYAYITDFGSIFAPLGSGGGGAVPEFSDYAMFAILATAALGFFAFNRKR